MELRIGQLSDSCFVCGQIEPGDIAGLAASGIRSIINNRPDGEQPGQAASSVIAEVAAELGLGYAHVPVHLAGITAQNVEDLRQALASLQGPVLLYCRSGTRSAMLWQLAGAV